MSSYSVTGSMPSISIGDVNLSDWTDFGEKELPNKKITLNIHEAHGGYIVEISAHSNAIGDLYIVSEDKDLGQEIGKIITHKILNVKHE